VSPRGELLDVTCLSPGQREEWRRLVDASGREGVFLEPEWLAAWQREIEPGWQPLVVGAREGSRLVAIAPFARRPDGPLESGRVGWMGSGRSDYLGILLDPGAGDEVLGACLDVVLETTPQLRLFDLGSFPMESRGLGSLVRAGRRSGLRATLVPAHACPYLDVRGTWNHYLDRRGGGFRSWLRRKQRWLEREGRVEFVHWRHPEEVAGHFDDAVRLYAMRWGESASVNGPSGGPRSRRFYREGFLAMAREGRLDFAALQLDGVAVAVALTIEHVGIRAYFMPAHDRLLDAFSPGTLLLAHLIERAHDGGATAFDFTIGDEAYKDRWADRRAYTGRLMMSRPGMAAAAAHAAAIGREHLRSRLRHSTLIRRAYDRLRG
jgi:CelD/BcsL family acetyltransferase involved in cellulose biosynthesis